MFTRWTKNAETKEDKAQWNTQVVAAIPVMKRLVTLLEEDLKSSEITMKKKATYSNPSWPYFLADLLGEQRAYNKAIMLIKNLYGENDS
jgi:hypothetical protein